MLMKTKTEETRNRALAIDRPDRAEKLRVSKPKGPTHPCYERGHDTVFLTGDRYGCCRRCGNEMLT